MPNAIKYNTSTETLALKKGNFWIGTGDVGKGPTNITGYYNGITPPSGGYTIYLNKESGGPSIYTVTSDAQLVSLTNTIAGTSYTTVGECFDYYLGQSDKMVLNFDYSSIITNGLICNLDAACCSSFPQTGSIWYDLSGNSNHGYLNSSQFVSNSPVSGSYLNNLNNESNFFYFTLPDTNSLFDTFSVTTGGWTIEEVIWTNSTNYPEADAGSLFSDAAYGTNATGFDWNHGYGIDYFGFGQSSDQPPGPAYEDVIVVATSPVNEFNTWRVRTMVWDRGNNFNSLYLNGSYMGGGSTPNTSGTSIYDRGTNYVGTLYGWKFYGRRGSFRIYNRVLSSTEILQNYNAQKGRYGL
jgi:Concanavalin A-like lectin/glucanases superfamily